MGVRRILPVALALWACRGGGGSRDAGLQPPVAPATPRIEAQVPLSLGPGVLPPVVGNVSLEMEVPAFRAARPRAYESTALPGRFHEELGRDFSAHYTFHEGRLYAVLVRQGGRGRDAARLHAEARRRFGAPLVWMGSQLYQVPGALLRIESDLGNLVLEVIRTAGPRPRPR
jgi:hypothetical protein